MVQYTNHGKQAAQNFIDITILVNCFVQPTFSLSSALFFFFQPSKTAEKVQLV